MTRSIDAELASSPGVDPVIQPFLQPDFDPVTFLNNTLPALSTARTTSTTPVAAYNNATSLTEIISQAQALLSKLSCQTTRLSNSLTQITDEIVRSGGRLAYEVELLRGEAIGLSEALEVGLKDDFEIFVSRSGQSADDNTYHQEQVDTKDILAEVPIAASVSKDQPQFLSKLHTLAVVREKLDSVIKLFDAAMKWPIAPVDGNTMSASLISVTAPATNEETRALEAKAKEYLDSIRLELNGLISQGAEGEMLAVQQVQHLGAVAEIWNGTAEEKARSKIVNELQKLVDDQRKSTVRSGDTPMSRPAMDYRYGSADHKAPGEGGYGFLSNLRNLKNEVYLD